MQVAPEPAPRRLGLHLERREIAQEIAISWCEIAHEIALPRAVAVLSGGDALPGGRVCPRAECAVEQGREGDAQPWSGLGLRLGSGSGSGSGLGLGLGFALETRLRLLRAHEDVGDDLARGRVRVGVEVGYRGRGRV